MNIYDIIKGDGTTEVPNPKYNRKSKKNIEPPTIKVPDNYADNDEVINFALKGMMEENAVDAKIADKYRQYGINFSYKEPELDRQLAEAQGAFTKFGNGLAQALVSEIGLGTLRGFSDLIDVIGQAVGTSDKDYSNPVSAKLEEWQDKFNNDVAPIYTTPGVDISNGGLTDMGWWASNMPSIMSSLTLLLPSTAVTKGVSLLGKGIKATTTAQKIGKTSKGVASWLKRATKLDESKRIERLASSWNTTRAIETRKAVAESAMSGTLSRVMENYQEARQTYTDMYKEASNSLSQMSDEEYADFLQRNQNTIGQDVNSDDRNEVAKAIARKSADETFKLDFANTAFDIWQIFALRNMPFKGFRKQPNRASVNVANKNSIRYAGMSVQEKADAIAARSKWAKGREHAWNYIKGSANAIGAQASEGVEEAVNYIAQQEGMNLGHVMLGMEDQSDFWDDRLEKYANAPELWESAFWGLMGGIVFQGLGSGFNRARGALEASIENRKKQYGKEDGKSGEKIEKPTWKELWQAPEVKRRIAEIEERDADFNTYLKQIEDINNDKSPFETDEQGISKAIDHNSKEAELLKDKAYNDMVTKMTLRALDTGNYDMLREFLTSDEVKKALIDKGVMTSEDASRTQADVAKTMDHIVQMYDENLEALNSMSSAINRRRANGMDGETIPVEYLQMIARDNINTQLSLENTQRELEAWEFTKQQKEEFARRGGALDSNVPYQDTVKLRNYTDALGNLIAQKKALEKNKAELETIDGQQKLKRINSTIDIVKNMILEINPDQRRANLLFALQNAAAYEQQTLPNNRTVTNLNYESEDYLAFRERVVNMDKQILAEYGDEFKDITEGEYQQLTVIEDNFRRADVVLQEAKKDLRENPNAPESAISKDLIDAYNAIADLQIGEQLLRKELVVNESQLLDRVSEYHNFMTEARISAIGKAKDNLFTLADRYGADAIRQAFREAFDTRAKSTQSSVLSDSDLRLFNESLDYLRLDKDANENLFGYVDSAIRQHSDIQAALREKKPASENQSSDTENAGSNNQSSQGLNAGTSQENGSQGNNNQQNIPQPLSNEEGVYLTYRDNGNGEIEAVVNLDNKQGRAIVESNNELVVNEDAQERNDAINARIEQLEQEINQTSDDNEIAKLERQLQKQREDLVEVSDQEYWYTADAGVSIIDDNYIIGEHPIVELDEQDNVRRIIKHGRLVLATPENQQVVEEAEAEAAQQQPTPAPAPAAQPTPIVPRPAGLNPDEAAAASVSPSSTGDVAEDVAPIPEVTPKEQIEDEIRKYVLNYLRNAIAKKDPINWSLIRDYLKDTHKGKLESEAELDALIEKGLRTYKLLADRRNIPQVADVVDTVIKASSIRENASPALKQDFDKSVDRLVTKYAKQVAADYIDGKYYISLTDLLRYCNQVCETNEAANMMYQALYDSLKRNKEKYVLTELTFEDFVANSKIDNHQRTQRLLDANGTYGINHDGLLRQMLAEKSPDVKQFNAILDRLKPGDKIDYEVNGDHIDFKVDGFRIGYLPIPKSRADGAMVQVNDELVTDILENKDGSINSNLKDLLVSWLDNDNINRKLCKAAFENLSDAERKKLAKEFLLLPEVQDAIKAGYIVEDPNASRLLEGLAKLWRFTRQYIGESEADARDRRAESIEDWFKYMVAPSFNMIYALEPAQRGTVTLETISEGELIRRDGQEPLPIAQAIGARHKGQIRIAISKTEGELTLAGKGINGETTAPFRGIAGGIGRSRTILVIPARDGNHGYVHMFPRPIRTMLEGGRHLAPGVAPLVAALQDEIQSITERHTNPKNQCTALEAYFRTLFDARTNANTPLLWGVRVSDFTDQTTGNKIGFTLIYTDSKGNNHTIRVSSQFNAGGNLVNRKSLRVSIDNNHYDNIEDGIKYLKQAITVGQFNIGISFVESDNDTKVDTRNPLVHRDDDGNFVITANGKEFKYKSFNDFIIDNNLVSVNTEPSSDGNSNYNHVASRLNQIATQRLKVSINAPVQNAPTVETNQPGLTTTADTVRQILEDRNNSNKGKAIAEAILGNKATNLRVGRELGSLLPKNVKINNTILSLFPNNIIFVDRYIGDNAFTNPGTKPKVDKQTGITVQPGQVVVGREFMDMINGNMADKRQAIRKLIHEQLHLIINNPKFKEPDTIDPVTGEVIKGRNRYIKQIESIYNKFKETIHANDYFSKYFFNDYYVKDEKTGKYHISDEGLEEFLVETLTSEELARKLNEIPSDETFKGTNNKKSLFQVIMEKLAKMFNWPIKKGSLYYEELQALRDVLSVDTSSETRQGESPASIPSTGEQMTIPFKDVEEEGDNATPTNESQAQATPPVERNDVATPTPQPTETPAEPEAPAPLDDDQDRNIRDRTRRAARKLRRSSRTETTPEYTDEMNQIKAEAIANGTFMKAPNGKPTKLNERQWLQVRTKAFKKWFGDWLNRDIPAVLDENGEPLVIHHGTNNKFDTFDSSLSIYTTDYEVMAKSYYFSEYQMYHELDNFEVKEEDYGLRREGAYERGLAILEDTFDPFLGKQELVEEFENFIAYKYPEYAQIVEHNGKNVVIGIDYKKIPRSEYSKIAEEYSEDRYPRNVEEFYRRQITGHIEDVYMTLKNPLIIDAGGSYWNKIRFNGEIQSTRDIEKYAEEHGYDGFIVKNVVDYGSDIREYAEVKPANIFVAFNPNQVKSATDNNGEFSTTDNNIRRSSRTEAPSVTAMVDRVPLDEQGSLIDNINNGNINISCR